jgi:hypothetical protein
MSLNFSRQIEDTRNEVNVDLVYSSIYSVYAGLTGNMRILTGIVAVSD